MSEEKPPVFGSWKGWYSLVMLALIAQIIVYWLITRTFA